MRYRILVFTVLASFLVLTPSTLAAAGCCDCCADKACCQEMTAACCKHDGNLAASKVLLPAPEQPVRQTAVVWFKNPVLVGDAILMGKYIIEHDNERMAQGLPCTHIYAAAKPQVPVVKFHCTHLDAARTDRDLVTVYPTGDASIPRRFAAFQFAGETAAHGMPRVR